MYTRIMSSVDIACLQNYCYTLESVNYPTDVCIIYYNINKSYIVSTNCVQDWTPTTAPPLYRHPAGKYRHMDTRVCIYNNVYAVVFRYATWKSEHGGMCQVCIIVVCIVRWQLPI